jgi:hypothetical protein
VSQTILNTNRVRRCREAKFYVRAGEAGRSSQPMVNTDREQWMPLCDFKNYGGSKSVRWPDPTDEHSCRGSFQAPSLEGRFGFVWLAFRDTRHTYSVPSQIPAAIPRNLVLLAAVTQGLVVIAMRSDCAGRLGSCMLDWTLARVASSATNHFVIVTPFALCSHYIVLDRPKFVRIHCTREHSGKQQRQGKELVHETPSILAIDGNTRLATRWRNQWEKTPTSFLTYSTGTPPPVRH